MPQKIVPAKKDPAIKYTPSILLFGITGSVLILAGGFMIYIRLKEKTERLAVPAALLIFGAVLIGWAEFKKSKLLKQNTPPTEGPIIR